jgi:hypothetical protein
MTIASKSLTSFFMTASRKVKICDITGSFVAKPTTPISGVSCAFFLKNNENS